MNTIDQEIAELRQRVNRLESIVQQSGAVIDPAPSTQATDPEPPAQRAQPAPRSEVTLPELPASVWIASAGALIFLIGVIYGLTVSIQRGWISPSVRVLAGMGTGLAFGIVAARTLLGSNRALGVALLLAATGTWTFAFYYGAHTAQLFPLALGFGGTALATLVAGALGARSRSDGALAVAIATGLVAPLAFADGTDRTPALLAFLLLLSTAHLAVNYLTGTGGSWRWSRALGAAGTWYVALAAAAADSPPIHAEWDLWLAAVLGLAVLVLAWLPAHPDVPWMPGAATVISQVALAIFCWSIWRQAGFAKQDFSGVLVALAAASGLLIAVARWRSGTGGHDLPLFQLPLGFAMVAVAIRLDWNWVVVAWGVSAALVAWAARLAAIAEAEAAPALQWSAVLAAVPATAIWASLLLRQHGGDTIFLNRVFGGGLLVALAWALQAVTAGSLRQIAFIALQLVAGNVLALELARAVPAIQIDGLNLAVGALLSTLVYALTGAGQWLWGVIHRPESGHSQALIWAGYGWLAVAAAKLLLHDLADAELLFRAAAALGVGTIFIGAALWASRAGPHPSADGGAA